MIQNRDSKHLLIKSKGGGARFIKFVHIFMIVQTTYHVLMLILNALNLKSFRIIQYIWERAFCLTNFFLKRKNNIFVSSLWFIYSHYGFHNMFTWLNDSANVRFHLHLFFPSKIVFVFRKTTCCSCWHVVKISVCKN